MNKQLLKTALASIFNLAGAYLMFYPQPYPYHIYKIVGLISLLFSYHVFYLEVKR